MPNYNRYEPRRSSPLTQPPWSQDDIPDPVYEEQEHSDEDTQQTACTPASPQQSEHSEQSQNPTCPKPKGYPKIPKHLKHLKFVIRLRCVEDSTQQLEQAAASEDAADVPSENEVPGLCTLTSQEESSSETPGSPSSTTQSFNADVTSQELLDSSSESDEDDDPSQSEYVLATAHPSQSAELSTDVNMTDASPYGVSDPNTPRTLWPGYDKGESMDMLPDMSSPTVADED